MHLEYYCGPLKLSKTALNVLIFALVPLCFHGNDLLTFLRRKLDRHQLFAIGVRDYARELQQKTGKDVRNTDVISD